MAIAQVAYIIKQLRNTVYNLLLPLSKSNIAQYSRQVWGRFINFIWKHTWPSIGQGEKKILKYDPKKPRILGKSACARIRVVHV